MNPETTPRTPHIQLSQLAPPEIQDELWSRMKTLPGVTPGRSVISGPQARALHLDPKAAVLGSPEAFAPGSTEFAHIHGHGDGSLHIFLPRSEARNAIEKGWAEFHPIVALGWEPVLVMVFGPRDRDELETVWGLVKRSYLYARGEVRSAA